jgi:hypothetical protein
MEDEDIGEGTIGGFKVYLGDGASPEAFTVWCEVFNIPEFGETNDLVEITSFCNGGRRRYKPGLSDGLEVEFQGNHISNSTIQEALRDHVINKDTVNLRIDDENISPAEQYVLNVAALSWRIGPVVDDRNTFIFGVKINSIEVPA